MRSLDISRCAIDEIEKNAFDPVANSLEELWLFGNSLNSIPSLNSLHLLKSLNIIRSNVSNILVTKFLKRWIFLVFYFRDFVLCIHRELKHFLQIFLLNYNLIPKLQITHFPFRSQLFLISYLMVLKTFNNYG